MTEQKIEICLNDSNGHEIGILTLKPEKQHNITCPKITVGGINFFNVPELDNKKQFPLQINLNPTLESAHIVLQEEMRYLMVFKSKMRVKSLIFPTMSQYHKNFIERKIDETTFYGSLNTRSYVGKSFIDVEIDGISSQKIPFEVRSSKINYEDHYPAMISDLFEAAAGIIFDSSPVFEPQKIDEIVRKTFYEDFIFFEYLFRPENLLTAYEHIRRDPHKTLKRYQEPVPLTIATSIGPSDLISMVSDPANLYKTNRIPSNWPKNMQNFVPYQINQLHYEEMVDNPENRLVKYFLQLVNDFLDKMVSHIKEKGLNGYASDKILEFHYLTREYLLDEWLDDVGELTIFPSNSQVLQKKEGYRDILRFFMILESAFFINWDEFEDLIKGYQRKLHELYEYWCYIKIFKILSQISHVKLDYNKMFVKSNEKEWNVSLKRGENSLPPFKIRRNGEVFTLELLYNRSFSRRSRPNRSYSLTLKPDFTIRIKKGLKNYLIHFDAKYRSDLLVDDSDVDNRDQEEEEKRIYKYADVYKMHTYKDAIKGSLGAYVLYPGYECRVFRENIEKILPSVGAFPLTPGGDAFDEENQIAGFIEDTLDLLWNEKIM